MISLIIVIAAIAFAGVSFAMRLFREQDLKNGLVLDKDEYTVTGTLSHIFQSQKKRIEREVRPRYREYVRTDRAARKKHLLSCLIFGCIIVSIMISESLLGGNRISGNVIMLVLIVSYAWSGNRGIPFVITAFAAINAAICLLAFSDSLQISSLATAAGFLVYQLRRFKEFEKWRK